MTKRMIIIDCTALCFRTAFGIQGNQFMSENNERTEIIYGFFKSLLFIRKHFPPEADLVFAWDSKDNKKARQKIYPEYKANRHSLKDNEIMDNETFYQMSDLQNLILPSMGFNNIFCQSERESDDVIASLVLTHKDGYDEITMVTNDNDLYQCLDKNVKMFKVEKGETSLNYTLKDFQIEWGVTPEQWVLAKSIAGCKTDNIYGTKGVAEKTACKFIRGELKEDYDSYKSIIAEENQKVIERNKELIKLPLEPMNDFNVKHNELLRSRKFLNVFERYTFNSFLRPDKFNEWEYHFNLE